MSLSDRLTAFARAQSRQRLLGYSYALLVLVGFVDYATGYEVPIYPFYAVPILLVVWFADRPAAHVITLLSALVWWWADVAAGHPYNSHWLQAWDILSRLMFFYLVMFAGTAVKQQRDAIRARVELLEHSQQLEHEIIAISERERQSIGRDLHDGMCQYLAAIGFSADLLRQDLVRHAQPGAGRAAEIARLLQDAVERVRELARGLSPVDRDEGGLELALDELALNTSQLTGKHCTFLCHEPVEIADNILSVHLFRIAQEAISNATRHGRARNIIIAVESDGGELSLRVSDDGVGIDPAPDRRGDGMGLNIMQYRARVIGATLEIYPNTPTGTVVSCTVPQGEKSEGRSQKAEGKPPPAIVPVGLPVPIKG